MLMLERADVVNTLILDFARMLSAEQCETIVRRATMKKLGTGAVNQLNDAQATEGWNLDTRGYVPHTPAADAPTVQRLMDAAGRQLLLAI